LFYAKPGNMMLCGRDSRLRSRRNSLQASGIAQQLPFNGKKR
jgi:hypothetical protein